MSGSLATRPTSLQAAAEAQLVDCSSFVLFDEGGSVLASSFEVDPAPEELRRLTAVFGERNAAITQGMVIQGKRYEVHQHHPPLVYGRTMSSDPENSVGAAACRVERDDGGQACYGVITYEMPNLSARMVPLLQEFCRRHLAAAQGGG